MTLYVTFAKEGNKTFNGKKMTNAFDVKSSDGLKLKFYHFDVAEVEPSALLCLVHGMGDHVQRHLPLINYMNGQGICVMAFDQRGHGRSEGLRGHSPSYDILMEDINLLISQAKEYHPHLPIVLYGHSMGGNLVLNYALRNARGIQAVIASSPWLRLAFAPPRWKMLLARLIYKIWPTFQERTGLNAEKLSHNPKVTIDYANDPLVHDKITAAFYVNLLEAGEWAIAHAHELKVPALLLHGSADEITSLEGTKTFTEHAKGKAKLHVFEQLYHEIHNEDENEKLFSLLVDWIRQHVVQ
ncbi:alpha/beta hydrolase [Olivibacter sitiensis]|uniref:alpha/beta hydrolase n=1 Tax=Olivibacter sitiensis TaxID=376470 RepID=UPI0003F71024|nr:alpha/beta hydrolase [Olivibacter sitiensis]